MPAQTLRVRDASKRQFFRIGEDPLNFTIEQAQLSKQRFTTARRQRPHQVFNHSSHPPHDLEIVRAAAADLAEGEIHKIVPVWGPENHAKLPGLIQQFVIAMRLLKVFLGLAVAAYCTENLIRVADVMESPKLAE